MRCRSPTGGTLWDNLCRHVERLVAAHHACLPEPTAPAMNDAGGTTR